MADKNEAQKDKNKEKEKKENEPDQEVDIDDLDLSTILKSNKEQEVVKATKREFKGGRKNRRKAELALQNEIKQKIEFEKNEKSKNQQQQKNKDFLDVSSLFSEKAVQKFEEANDEKYQSHKKLQAKLKNAKLAFKQGKTELMAGLTEPLEKGRKMMRKEIQNKPVTSSEQKDLFQSFSNVMKNNIGTESKTKNDLLRKMERSGKLDETSREQVKQMLRGSKKPTRITANSQRKVSDLERQLFADPDKEDEEETANLLGKKGPTGPTGNEDDVNTRSNKILKEQRRKEKQRLREIQRAKQRDSKLQSDLSDLNNSKVPDLIPIVSDQNQISKQNQVEEKKSEKDDQKNTNLKSDAKNLEHPISNLAVIPTLTRAQKKRQKKKKHQNKPNVVVPPSKSPQIQVQVQAQSQAQIQQPTQSNQSSHS